MAVRARYTARRGSTSLIVFVFARDAEDPVGKTGLAHDVAGASASYVREGDRAACAITLAQGRVGRWAAGGLAEVDAELLPGLYQLGVPDEALAPGSERAIVEVQFPGVEIDPVEIALVAYDPQDQDHLGLGSLDPDYHEGVLRRGMPGLTKLELELWQQDDGRE
jgi:hypothetical protein